MPKELLIEIGTEEIPAGFLPPAFRAMEELAAKALNEARLEHGTVTAMGNPRRLVLHVEGIADRQPDTVRVAYGPPKKAAYDADGNPTKAATGFARSQGVEVSELTVEDTDKGEYLCARVAVKGVDAKDALAALLPRLILSIPFPKSMRWMDKEVRFARPIHWLLAILDGEVVPFDIDGLKSGNLSRGHRFMSPGAFLVKNYTSYINHTKENFTIVDPQARLDMVRSQVEAAASNLGAKAIPDEGLLREISNLVEYPTAVVGSFDREFLALPRELLVNSMREHQRYFALTTSDGGLKPNFITISNTKAEDMEVVRAGNERVLRARLSDAKFFFEEDMKRPLADRVDDLKKVLFQEKLGSTYDKVQRVVALAAFTADTLYRDEIVRKDSERAALLCKADLVTSMVYEFANLQGIVGADYARRNGEREEVAKAIVEHYMPRFSGDDVPGSPAGTAVSIADKMDTIVGIFSIGKSPTGSEDPYALRRQSLGIIAMIYKGGFRTSLRGFISKAAELLGLSGADTAKVESDVLEFFRQRVANQLGTEGFVYDTVDAVLARGFDDIIGAKERVAALSEFRKAEGFAPFITAFKRVANIIPEGFSANLDEALLKEPSEKELYRHFMDIKDEVGTLMSGGRYLDALNRVSEVRPYVDSFFDAVMVMDKDEAVKQNRLALMALLAGVFMGFADLRKVVV
ncbi:MAG: glycine--tRNA ligase subunit beta [Nitrospirae bacterium]|nr:glycine--tRNA ligase subunit beta [Nitrospirota bacterium]